MRLIDQNPMPFRPPRYTLGLWARLAFRVTGRGSMEIRQLIYFSTTFRQGSVTRAAEELMISQPALSRQIRRFEREIGTPLFERVPTGVTATAAGVALYRHALAILDL